MTWCAAVVASALLVGLDCGAERERAVPVESCEHPVADPLLARNRWFEGALRAGPLVIYPVDGLARIRRRPAMGAIIVVVTDGARPVTLSVGRPARDRFSLLFAGATTGRRGREYRIAHGLAAVRFPTCGGRPMGFRGGFLYRGAQCVPLTVRAGGGPALRATIAAGRPPESCPGALRPRPA
jgi:hypothetical protein